MNQHKYKIKWETKEPEVRLAGYTKEEVGLNSFGTDAFVYISILYPEDGSFRVEFQAADGRSGKLTDLSDIELFKVWTLLASRLSDSSELDQNRRYFCEEVFNVVKQVISTTREKDEQIN